MLKISHVSKSYGETLVLDDIDFEIASNSFVAFLGPSGCGKTTLLRMIAGLIDVSGGQIILGDKRIDNIKPSLRDVAMVFQSYALYPHMSVYDNMAFGLKNLKVEPQIIEERIKNAMRILEIGHLSDKKPGQLSGGQRQRVAIGRAIVKNPKIFLFDEPLSNLDASLRVRTRIELAQLHKRMNAIMVMVTHDQIEAMTLADTIVVLNDKKIQQIGSPIEIYTRPKNQFVASFVGSPSINYFDVKIEKTGEKISAQINNEISILLDLPFSASQKYENYKLGLRPEFLRHVVSGEFDFKAEVEFVERLGERAIFYVKFGANNKLAIQAEGNAKVPEDGMIGIKIIRAGAILFDNEGLAIYNNESQSK